MLKQLWADLFVNSLAFLRCLYTNMINSLKDVLQCVIWVFVISELIHMIGSMTLSSPPVAGVWWAHWRRCPVSAVTSSNWMLHTGGGWGETPPPPPHMIQ